MCDECRPLQYMPRCGSSDARRGHVLGGAGSSTIAPCRYTASRRVHMRPRCAAAGSASACARVAYIPLRKSCSRVFCTSGSSGCHAAAHCILRASLRADGRRAESWRPRAHARGRRARPSPAPRPRRPALRSGPCARRRRPSLGRPPGSASRRGGTPPAASRGLDTLAVCAVPGTSHPGAQPKSSTAVTCESHAPLRVSCFSEVSA